MYDSVNPFAIPATAAVVAGYVNGPRSQWPASGWDRFPGAVKIRIDVNGTDPFGSDVIDVENGDATPATAAQWVRARQDRGWWSAAYCSLANLPALRQALAGLHCVFWVAEWTGTPHMVSEPGVVATQYRNEPGFDLSLVADDWFPSPAPAPAGPTKADAVAALGVLQKYLQEA